MKILDILKSKVPNEFKAKAPKVKVYMVPASPYGVDADAEDEGMDAAGDGGSSGAGAE